MIVAVFYNYFHATPYRRKLICALTFGLMYVVFKKTNISKYSFYFYKLKKLLHNSSRETNIVSTVSGSKAAVEQLNRKCCEKPIIGMDCEWVTRLGKRHPIALLQLAASDGFCTLFRLSSMKTVPNELLILLEDKNILKVGVGIMSDARYLLADYGVRCEGCLDLRHLASKTNVEARGLASLAKELLEEDLDKDWRVRCSDWEAETLTPNQIQYAAQDACIAMDIFDKLNHMEICRKYSLWRRLCWSNQDYWNNSSQIWTEYVGLNFKNCSKVDSNQATKVCKSKPINNTLVKRNCNTSLQKEHYDNIYLQAPDTRVLCTTGVSKAAWYVQNGLADVICENPKILRLKFEPKNRIIDGNGYYTKPKENRCVVCGSEDNLRRKNIIPAEYRKHFEVSLKKHHSHDVLLLCLSCHTSSNMYDQSFREQLNIQCNAPFRVKENNRLSQNPELKTLKSAARALYRDGSKFSLPKDRKSELAAILTKALGVSSEQLTQDFLEKIINMECYEKSKQYVPHGQRVVQYYEQPEVGGVEILERRWRQHFVDSMSPRYLPDLWSVNYTREKGKYS